MKVGDYVRTKYGNIGRIIEYHTEPSDYYFNCYETDLPDNLMEKYLTEYADIKSSPNIIDLIEVGDYVNGKEITQVIPPDICGDEELTDKKVYINDFEVYEEWIKSIVTKEQFESMEYRK